MTSIVSIPIGPAALHLRESGRTARPARFVPATRPSRPTAGSRRRRILLWGIAASITAAALSLGLLAVAMVATADISESVDQMRLQQARAEYARVEQARHLARR